MLKTIFSLLAAISLVVACTDLNESPDAISQDIDLESLPWVEDKSTVTIELYDEKGNLINTADKVQMGGNYKIVIKSEKPMAVHIKDQYGFSLIGSTKEALTISDSHSFMIKKPEQGIQELILGLVPLYYVDDVLTKERPQLFLFPKKDK